MFGPLFGKELLEVARRRRYYLARFAVGAALLLFLLTLDSAVRVSGTPTETTRQLAERGRALFDGYSVGAVLGLMLLVPAMTCGLIAGERDNRTFDALLTTGLSDRELLAGKLASRLTVALMLSLSCMPALMVAGFYGGFGGLQLALAVSIQCSVALVAAAVGLHYSVATRKPYVALLRTYAALGFLWYGVGPAVGLASWLSGWTLGVGRPLPTWVANMLSLATDPMWMLRHYGLTLPQGPFDFSRGTFAFSPVSRGAGVARWAPLLLYYAVSASLAGLLILWTARRLRADLPLDRTPWLVRAAGSVYRGLVGGSRAVAERLSALPLFRQLWAGELATRQWSDARRAATADRNPIAYRDRVANVYDPERYVTNLQFVVWAVFLAFVVLQGLAGHALLNGLFGAVWSRGLSYLPSPDHLLAGFFFLVVTTLAASAFARERQYGSWELLMMTDVGPFSQVRSALAAVFWRAMPTILLVGVVAMLKGFAGIVPLKSAGWFVAALAFGLLLASSALVLSAQMSRILPSLLFSYAATALAFGLGPLGVARVDSAWLFMLLIAFVSVAAVPAGRRRLRRSPVLAVLPVALVITGIELMAGRPGEWSTPDGTALLLRTPWLDYKPTFHLFDVTGEVGVTKHYWYYRDSDWTPMMDRLLFAAVCASVAVANVAAATWVLRGERTIRIEEARR